MDGVVRVVEVDGVVGVVGMDGMDGDGIDGEVRVDWEFGVNGAVKVVRVVIIGYLCCGDFVCRKNSSLL